MKKILIVSALFFFLMNTAAWAQKEITPAEASKYIDSDKKVTVVGTVDEIYRTEKVVRLNMGGTYPDNLFVAVIFSSDTTNFTDINSYKGKEVEVTGTIEEYKGKPEIILKEKDQLKLHD